MANNKKRINWIEIESRYKSGERPVDIARDYLNCDAAKIRDKAYRGGWTREKEQIRANINESLENDTLDLVKRIRERYEHIAFGSIQELNKQGFLSSDVMKALDALAKHCGFYNPPEVDEGSETGYTLTVEIISQTKNQAGQSNEH